MSANENSPCGTLVLFVGGDRDGERLAIPRLHSRLTVRLRRESAPALADFAAPVDSPADQLYVLQQWRHNGHVCPVYVLHGTPEDELNARVPALLSRQP